MTQAPSPAQVLCTTYHNELPGHHRKLLARRQGISDTVLKLLQRAAGLDLLLANEQVEERVEYVDFMEDENGQALYFREVTATKLYFPVPGYRGGSPWALT